MRCPVDFQKKISQQSGAKDQEGYIVKYPDGYISWSPKEVFEEAYRELVCTDFINEDS